MQIIEFNHKTVSALLKKSVAEYWMKDKDAWLKFEDGSVVCIHAINPTWQAYVSVEICDYAKAVNDSQELHLYYNSSGDERLFMQKHVSIILDGARYYYSDQLDYVTREYLPVIEFHYYEKGEEVARNDS